MESASTCSVCLSFDFDAMSLWLATFKRDGPQAVSRGEYGARVGVPRILELLAAFEAEATFFVPAHTVRTYPEAVREICEAGHELANHGDFHELMEELTPDQERDMLARADAVLADASGRDIVGFRAPAGDLTASTIPTLLDLGYLYDSSLFGDDFRPYRCRVGDRQKPDDSAYHFGNEVDLVELPISFLLDDFPYFEFNFSPYLVGQADPDVVGRIWRAEFDYMVDHVSDGVVVIVMHPQCIGRGSRMVMLERLMEHMRERGAVFRSMRDVATSFLTQAVANR